MTIARDVSADPPTTGPATLALKREQVRLAVVGLGFGAHVASNLIQNSGEHASVRLVKLCDSDAARAAAVATKLNLPFTTDFGQVLADPAVDAVGLFTGPVGRGALIQRVVRAGKHVMTTKPFERSSQAAREALAEARRCNRVVHLNSPSALPAEDLAQIMRWQRQYPLGRLIGCHQSIWANYREQASGSWYDDPLQCPAAPLFRLGIYAINDLIRLMPRATDVCVLSSRIFTGRPTADNATMSIRFEDGTLASIYCSFCIDDTQPYANSMTLNMERGTIYRNIGILPEARSQKAHLSLVAHVSGQRITQQAEVDSTSGGYQWDVFARAIAGEQIDGLTTDEKIVQGIQIIEAMVESEIRSGSCVAIRP